MKRRKSFTEHIKAKDQTLNESLLSKGYAISQNAKHNTTSTALASKASKMASLASDVITANELEDKINKIADTLIQLSEVLKLQNNQSAAIKNVVVASALFQAK